MRIQSNSQKQLLVQDKIILGLVKIDFLIAAGLVVVIISSALSVSFVSQKNRHLFTQLELLRKDSAELHSRWTRLLLERSTLGSNVRIENVARNKLQLKPARPQDTVIIE
ncbi:MAG: cell division protein FtsL [Sinobacterium sp.]|jgi:cell division protein FtsL